MTSFQKIMEAGVGAWLKSSNGEVVQVIRTSTSGVQSFTVRSGSSEVVIYETTPWSAEVMPHHSSIDPEFTKTMDLTPDLSEEDRRVMETMTVEQQRAVQRMIDTLTSASYSDGYDTATYYTSIFGSSHGE